MKTLKELQKIADSLTVEELRAARKEAGVKDPRRTGFPYPFHSPSPVFFVKFGNQDARLTAMETETQIFTRDALEVISRSTADIAGLPYVPKVFRIVADAYVVMEYVQGTTLLQISETKPWEELLEYTDRIARAIDILLTIPIPPDASPGPYRGGVIRHPLFKDGEAQKIFKDVTSLQEHVNYMSGMPQNSRYEADPPRPQCTLDSRLYLVWGDFYPGNFMFDAEGALWIIDFGHVNFLPLCFQTYALLHSFPRSMPYSGAVYRAMKTELPTHNMQALTQAHYWFTISITAIGIPRAERWRRGWEEDDLVDDRTSFANSRSRLEAMRDALDDVFYSWRGGYTYVPLMLAGAALGLGLALRYMGGRRTR